MLRECDAALLRALVTQTADRLFPERTSFNWVLSLTNYLEMQLHFRRSLVRQSVGYYLRHFLALRGEEVIYPLRRITSCLKPICGVYKLQPVASSTSA